MEVNPYMKNKRVEPAYNQIMNKKYKRSINLVVTDGDQGIGIMV